MKSPIFLRGEETEKVTASTKFERPYRMEYSPQAYIYIYNCFVIVAETR